VRKRFGSQEVLKGIDLHIRRGRTRVILGLSGSGKSVLMKHLIGLLRPDSGRIYIDDEDLAACDERARQRLRSRFGMVFQQAALFDSMSVFDNVAFPLREHRKLTDAELRAVVADKLRLVSLENVGEKYPAELSGGMRKRVGLARAVVLEPQCVLYDEPTTGLDPLTTESVDQMIKDAAARLRVTSVVISHDIGSALNIADDIAVIHEGEIVADTDAAGLQGSEHPFVQRFLATWFGKQGR
jgi:phospholipid/cholesterol/gamma-HCH transport system ATP-binding protein